MNDYNKETFKQFHNLQTILYMYLNIAICIQFYFCKYILCKYPTNFDVKSFIHSIVLGFVLRYTNVHIIYLIVQDSIFTNCFKVNSMIIDSCRILWFLIIQTTLNYQLTIDMFGINLIIVIFWRSTLLYQLPFNILSNLYLHIGCNPNCLYFPQILHLMTNQFRLKDCAGCNSWCQNPTRRTINRKCYKPKITRYQF